MFYNRLEKMLWIKDVLADPKVILKQGWARKKKTYFNTRRVEFVKGNYVVIIRFTGFLKASFVTVYEMQANEDKVMNSSKWIRDERFVKK